MRPIKYDAIHNDMRLMEMALYETTRGQTHNTSQELIVKKLSEYKRLIKRGTYTIDQLEDKIYSQFGIINERSRTDSAIYDASSEMEDNPLNSLFSCLFRKAQGLDSLTSPDSSSQLQELDDKFTQDQLDEDFPDFPDSPDEISEEPEKPEELDEFDFLDDPDDNLPF